MADAFETILVAWIAFAFLPERPTRSQGGPTVRIRFPPAESQAKSLARQRLPGGDDASRRRGDFGLMDGVARAFGEAHGEIPTDIIAVDLAAVEAFLGRIGDPEATPGATVPERDAGLRAIMFTDIVGSTEMTARLGDAAAFEIVRVHDSLVRRGLAAHSGREVKHTGDGITAAFDEVADAVQAAADIQRHVLAHSHGAAEKLRVRIGIHAGEPITDHNDLFGRTVQLAARLCSEADPGAVVVSELVRELCHLDTACFAPLGERQLKGFAELVPVFRLEWRN